MLYANDDALNLVSKSKLNNLKIKGKNGNSQIKKFIQKNKMISILLVMFGVFSIMNSVLIYTFMRLLKNI